MAIAEVKKWLDYKCVNPKKQEEFKVNVDAMADALVDGTFTLNDDMSITHNLNFPVGSEKQVKEIKYKPRLTAMENRVNCKGDYAHGDGRIVGIIAGLTGLPKNIIEALDTEDFGMAGAVALFFLT